jgi:nitrogen fixation/metabolism regulation signal transduction histidine kinase
VKAVRIHRKNFFLNVRGLALIYLLLCILTVLFSRYFFITLLQEGAVPGVLPVILFFTLPIALLAFLLLSVGKLIRDYIARRSGGVFQIRLFVYFIITVVLAAVPVTIITIQVAQELLHFWRSIRLRDALENAQRFALDSYALQLDAYQTQTRSSLERTDQFMTGPAPGEGRALLPALGEELLAIQDFRQTQEGLWLQEAFAGDASQQLRAPPGVLPGFAPREIPRDQDVIRYLAYPRKQDQDRLRVYTYSLGQGFDEGVRLIETEKARFDAIETLSINLQPLLVFYYGVFLFPNLLMTLIIAISFSRRVTEPLVELAEATRRVAEGDFSIQIFARPRDELGLLIASFNTMVRDLEQSRNALLKAEKISIWQTMAQQLAHEIKNPLTPIKLSAERLLRRWQNNPERIGEILESSALAIIQEVEGLSNLLTEFRTLSRPTEPGQTWIVLGETVEELLGPYRGSYPKIQFDTRHIEPEIRLRIDKRHIGQILTNLILNAVDAMDGAGVIEIRTDLVKKRENRYCRLSIRDTGKGMSRQEGERIFTPYFTTKESGTGLGLPIVERLVHDHGGSIWFHSGEGMGTVFYIDFPLDGADHGGP